MSLWDHRQFAMELVASGQPVSVAIDTVMQFERQWSVASAVLSAKDVVFKERLKVLPSDKPGSWSRADAVKWMRETHRLVRVAEAEARQDACDALEDP